MAKSTDQIHTQMQPEAIDKVVAMRKSEAPLRTFLQSLQSSAYRHMEIPVLLLCAYLARLVIGLGPFSGKNNPPMYGDFEAQRHWLELTQHLPLEEWYKYDLQYWGLDYPPLTAFHSWICGKIGSAIEQSWFSLDASRGKEAYGLIVFMRHTVIFSELVTYVPAILLFASLYRGAVVDRTFKTLLILLQPSVLLIDHGHFQYNTVMLGFLVFSIYFVLRGRLYVGAISYVMCLSFKQMGLYYAPAMFAYLLSLTIGNLRRLATLSVVTIASFAVIFGPFILNRGLDGLNQVLVRMFPFGRGLFEDKVANFWCAFNVIYKLKSKFEPSTLQNLSLLATLASVVPGNIALFLRPTGRNLILGTANCAWGFFLFAFQVHEKSVLLPLIPSSLLVYSTIDSSWISYVNIVASFSLWPLLKKDGLYLQYFVYNLFWIWIGGLWRLRSGTSLSSRLQQFFQAGTYILIIVLHALEPIVTIEGKPDIHVVLNVLLCTPAFFVFYSWTFYQLVRKDGPMI